MVKVLKNKMDITGVAVFLMAFFVAVGFTTAKEMQQGGWYEVEDTGATPGNPENQEIGDYLPNGPQGDCEETSGLICAVELQIETGSSFPSNMHEADSLSSVQILDESFRNQ